MVYLNHSTMQMVAKIVYYGPGLCGKTTNLKEIYRKTSKQSRGEMVSLETETDRTLFFDLLPIDVGLVSGFKTKFQLYTVPGQVFYNTTRKLVLKGVDGIVFVADSQVAMLDANLDSLENLKDNLRELGMDPSDIPMVIQYNKRDLDHIHSVDVLNQSLNPHGRYAHTEAIALQGVGVFETLKEISRRTLLKLRQKHLDDPEVEEEESGKSSRAKKRRDIEEARFVVKEKPSGVDTLPNGADLKSIGMQDFGNFDEDSREVKDEMPEDVSFEDYGDDDTDSDLEAMLEADDMADDIAIDPESFDLDLPGDEIDLLEDGEIELDETDITETDVDLFETPPPMPSPPRDVQTEKMQAESFETLEAEIDESLTVGSEQPPPIPFEAAPTAGEDVEQAPKKVSIKSMDVLERTLSSIPARSAGIRPQSIKSTSVDDLLTGLVSGKGSKTRVERISIRKPAAGAQVNCVFLDDAENVIHTELLKVVLQPIGPGAYRVNLKLDVRVVEDEEDV